VRGGMLESISAYHREDAPQSAPRLSAASPRASQRGGAGPARGATHRTARLESPGDRGPHAATMVSVVTEKVGVR
jgi:hypothetical protein